MEISFIAKYRIETNKTKRMKLTWNLFLSAGAVVILFHCLLQTLLLPITTFITTADLPNLSFLSMSSRAFINTCPIIPIGSCTFWNTTSPKSKERKVSWVWNNACPPPGHIRARKTINVARIPSGSRRFDDLTKNQTSVVFFGSSHIRELYKEFIRLHRGLDYNGKLPREVKQVSNGLATATCDPNRTGYKEGLYGIDLDACGEPGKRMVPELGKLVAIGFKTFLHTPMADQLFVDWLTNHTLRYPNVLVTDVGVWGPRGQKMAGALNYSLTLEQEIDHNINWLRTTFPTTALIFIVEHQFYDVGIETLVNPRLIDFVKTDHRSVVLRKDLVMTRMPSGMKCDHACSGPVLVVLVHLILDWLQETINAKNDCINKE